MGVREHYDILRDFSQQILFDLGHDLEKVEFRDVASALRVEKFEGDLVKCVG